MIGLLHPGEMGAAVGAALRAGGQEVLWASDGRSGASAERARRAGLADGGSVREVVRRCDVILSVCPPQAAVEVARSAAGFDGLYVDANAVSPMTARTIAPLVRRCVDGGIIGPPPSREGTTRLYLSGPEAGAVADLFAGTLVDARVVSAEIGAASAVKMAYAAWTKGTAALLLGVRALARVQGVEQTLLEEWDMSQPQLADRSATAGRSALTKGWRWLPEMNEIADTFAGAGLPDGFHRAAAETYGRFPRGCADGGDPVEQALAALCDPDAQA